MKKYDCSSHIPSLEFNTLVVYYKVIKGMPRNTLPCCANGAYHRDSEKCELNIWPHWGQWFNIFHERISSVILYKDKKSIRLSPEEFKKFLIERGCEIPD